MHLKFLQKQEQTKAQISWPREILNIRADTKKLHKELMKQKLGSLKRLTRSTNPLPTWQNGGGKEPKLIKSEIKNAHNHKY
jgi:hypothetical protein